MGGDAHHALVGGDMVGGVFIGGVDTAL